MVAGCTWGRWEDEGEEEEEHYSGNSLGFFDILEKDLVDPIDRGQKMI